MRMKDFVVVQVLALGAGILLIPAATQSQIGTLDARAIDKILSGVAKGFQDADSEDKVIKARKRLIDEYRDAESRGAGYAFARAAAEKLRPLLGKGLKADDPLRMVKIVNLAIALSNMPQASIQPALGAMIAHKSPAVRFYGWAGYLEARRKVLGQGEEFADTMIAAVEKTGDQEQSVAVLSGMFRTLDMGVAVPAGVSQKTWKQWRQRTLAALERNWNRWCGIIASGDKEMSVAFLPLISVLQGHAAELENDKEKIGPLVQMVYDAGWYASWAYKNAGHGTSVANANGLLLRRWEEALNAMTGAKNNFVITAVTKGPAPFGDAVRLAVIANWLEALKEFKIAKPEEPTPKPVPATQPSPRSTATAAPRPAKA